MNANRIVVLTALGILGLFFLMTVGGIWETVDAGEIVVLQDMMDGELHVWKTPGPKLQLWGHTTHYRQSSQFWFKGKDPNVEDSRDQSIKVRFNDGGHASISGSLRVDFPADEQTMLKLHQKYRSQEAVEQQLIRTIVEKSVYMSGPLMSSTESYAERRSDLIRFIEDQIQGGVYKSETTYEKIKDPTTGAEKTVSRVNLVPDGHGGIARQEESPLAALGLRSNNFSINSMDYDEKVEKQIEQQQQAVMQVQTAAARAREAEQRALTAAKEGEANAAQAKWKQETIKAEQVTLAEQKKEVARLSKEAAEYKKQEDILPGEGEAARRKAVMAADGALDKKLAAWVEIQKAYADAMKAQKLVPDIQFGGGATSGAGAGAQNFMDLMMVKAARDLALDLHTVAK